MDYKKEKGPHGTFLSVSILAASLYGKIESYEEIHLMDLLPLNMADDIDDGERTVYDETTGGIPVNFITGDSCLDETSYLTVYPGEL